VVGLLPGLPLPLRQAREEAQQLIGRCRIQVGCIIEVDRLELPEAGVDVVPWEDL